MLPDDNDTELIPLPDKLPTVCLEYGELPSTAEWAQRCLATYRRTEVKPPWLSLGPPVVAEAAGVLYRRGPFTPLPVTPERLAVIVENLVTMSYIDTIWGLRCRRMAIDLVAELGIVWPDDILHGDVP